MNESPVSPQAPPPISEPPVSQPLWRNKRLLILAAIAVVVLGGVAYLLFGRSGSNKVTEIPVTSLSVANDLAKAKLTQADLDKIDKTDAYFSYIMNATQQQKTTITSANKYGESPTALEESVNTYKVGFDYQTKKIVFAHDDNFGVDISQNRCYDGNSARHATQKSDWYVNPIDEESPCVIGNSVNYYLSDGVTPGGLTQAQATKYVGYLRQQAGLITVKKVQLAEHKGKQYLHFSVDLNAIDAKGFYLGGQWLMWAFKETGLDPATHPFEYRIRGGEGMHIEYYVDPVAKLPVYSEMKSTPLKDKDGKERAFDGYRDIRTVYQFGAAEFDASPQNPAPLSIDW